ncbi:hypothetical protein QOT17_024150 [Balamuthia mandrillaris]
MNDEETQQVEWVLRKGLKLPPGCSELYAKNFIANDVDASLIPLLDRELLVELGISDEEHLSSMVKLIGQLNVPELLLERERQLEKEEEESIASGKSVPLRQSRQRLLRKEEREKEKEEEEGEKEVPWLPHELMSIVFSFMPWKYVLTTARLVSKEWNSAALYSVKQLIISKSPTPQHKFMHAFSKVIVPRCHQTLTKLELRYLPKLASLSGLSSASSSFAPLFPNLQQLIIMSNCLAVDDVLDFLPSSPRHSLTDIKLHAPVVAPTAERATEVLRRLVCCIPSLQTLQLDCFFCPGMEEKKEIATWKWACPGLRELKLWDEMVWNWLPLPESASLEKLRLHLSIGLSNVPPPDCSKCTTLKTIKLKGEFDVPLSVLPSSLENLSLTESKRCQGSFSDLPALKYLKFYCVGGDSWTKEDFFKTLPSSLETLIVEQSDVSNTHLFDLPITISKLTLIHCNRVTGQCLHALPRSLQKLTIHSNSTFNNSDLAHLPPTLLTCRLEAIHGLNDRGLEAAVSSLSIHSLTELSLASCTELTSKSLSECLRLMRQLRKLNLQHCMKADDHTMKMLPPGIRELNVFGCALISDLGMKYLPVGLKRLNIAFVPNLTEKGLRFLPSGLEWLDMSNCGHQLTHRSLKYLPLSLHTLILQVTCIDDGGPDLKHEGLKNLPPRLCVLDLQRCRTFSHKSLVHLPPTLRRLDVRGFLQRIPKATIDILSLRIPELYY